MIKILKFHHGRDLPEFSSQHASAADLPTRRKTKIDMKRKDYKIKSITGLQFGF